jgi:hypothetical protein
MVPTAARLSAQPAIVKIRRVDTLILLIILAARCARFYYYYYYYSSLRFYRAASIR